MQGYKRILLLTCSADTWLALVVFIVQPVCFNEYCHWGLGRQERNAGKHALQVHLVGRGNMILVSNGFFAGHSQTFDHISLAVYCGSLHSSIVCVVIQFFLRYRSTCYASEYEHATAMMALNYGTFSPKTPTLIFQFVVFAILYSATQATDATFTFAVGHTEEVRRTALGIIEEHYKWNFTAGSEPYPTLSHYVGVRDEEVSGVESRSLRKSPIPGRYYPLSINPAENA